MANEYCKYCDTGLEQTCLGSFNQENDPNKYTCTNPKCHKVFVRKDYKRCNPLVEIIGRKNKMLELDKTGMAIRPSEYHQFNGSSKLELNKWYILDLDRPLIIGSEREISNDFINLNKTFDNLIQAMESKARLENPTLDPLPKIEIEWHMTHNKNYSIVLIVDEIGLKKFIITEQKLKDFQNYSFIAEK